MLGQSLKLGFSCALLAAAMACNPTDMFSGSSQDKKKGTDYSSGKTGSGDDAEGATAPVAVNGTYLLRCANIAQTSPNNAEIDCSVFYKKADETEAFKIDMEEERANKLWLWTYAGDKAAYEADGYFVEIQTPQVVDPEKDSHVKYLFQTTTKVAELANFVANFQIQAEYRKDRTVDSKRVQIFNNKVSEVTSQAVPSTAEGNTELGNDNIEPYVGCGPGCRMDK